MYLYLYLWKYKRVYLQTESGTRGMSVKGKINVSLEVLKTK